MESSLESFFDELKSEADLDKLVREGREEDLHLEFKQKEDRRDGKVGERDKKNFSKAVSGFANADGGILIFGIETDTSGSNPARAVALKPITNAEQFLTRLRDSILNTTQPPVDGVRVELVPGKLGEGYVKCLIPASEAVPHRAMQADNQYWRRMSGGNFRLMEHYELEEVFGRRMRPLLRLRVKLQPRPDPDPHEDLHFFILNEGRGLAHHVGFLCKIDEGRVARTSSVQLTNVSNLNGNRPVVGYYNPTGVIHPNGIFSASGYAVIIRPTKGSPLPIEVTWYAENMPTRSERALIHPGKPELLTGHSEFPILPLARPTEEAKGTPVAGRAKGMLLINSEDEEHLKDFAEYMP